MQPSDRGTRKKEPTNTAAQMAQQAGQRAKEFREQQEASRKTHTTASFSNEQKGNAVTITETSSAPQQQRKPIYWTPSFSNEQKGNAVQNPRTKTQPSADSSAYGAAKKDQEAAKKRKTNYWAPSSDSSTSSSSSTTSKRPDSYYWTPKEPTGNASAVMAAQQGKKTNDFLDRRKTEDLWTKRGEAQTKYWETKKHEESAAEIRKEYYRRKAADATQKEEEDLNLARITLAANGNEFAKAAIKGTSLESAAWELSRRWGMGEAISPVYKDGKIDFVGRPDQKAHFHYEVDANGNWVAPTNQEQKNLNQDLLDQGIMEHNSYLNTNDITHSDIVRNKTDLQKYKEGLEKGMTEDFDYVYEDGTTRKASEIVDELLDSYDRAEENLKIRDRYNGFVDYLFSEDRTLTDTKANEANLTQWRDEAVLDGNQELADAIDQLLGYYATAKLGDAVDEYNDHRGRLFTLEDAQKELKAEEKDIKRTAAANGVETNLPVVLKQQKHNKKLQGEENEAMAALKTEIKDMAPDEVKAAMERLGIAKLGKAYPDAGNKANAERMRAEDQALVDGWMRSVTLNPEFYNWQSALAGFSESKVKQWGSAAANTLSLGLRLAGESMLKSGDNVNGPGLGSDAILPTRPKDQEALREAERKRNEAAYKWNATHDPADKAELDRLEEEVNRLENDRETYDPTEEFANKVIGTGESINKWATKNYEDSQKLMNQVKEGKGKTAQFGIDVASTLADIGFDTLTHLGLGNMAIRVAGSSAMDYQETGVDTIHQALGAALNVLLETGTEKIGGTLGFAYGKGYTDNAIDAVIESLASTKAGMNGLRLLTGVISEGGEEVASDLLSPFIDYLADNVHRDDWQYELDSGELLRDFLVGGVAGLFGDVVSAKRGEYTEKNNAILAEDAKVIAEAEEAEATGQPLTEDQLRRLDRAQNRAVYIDERGRVHINPNAGSGSNVSGNGAKTSNGSVSVDENGRVHVNTNRGKTSGDRRDVVIANATREGVGLTQDEETDVPTREEQIQAKQDKAIDLEQTERDAANEAYQAEQEARLAGIEENNRLEEESKYTDENDMSRPEPEEDVSDEDLAQIRHDISEEEYLDSLGTKEKPGEPATASETAQGEAQGSPPTDIAPKGQKTVKPAGTSTAQASFTNQAAEAVEPEAGLQELTKEERDDDAKTVTLKLKQEAEKQKARTGYQQPISVVRSSDFQKVEGESIIDKVGSFFSKLGNAVKSKALGGREVILDERGVKNDIAHGLGRAKAATFAAVPDVIANGKVIDEQKNWKGRGYDTKLIAGPISIDGSPAYVGCVVTEVEENGKTRFYLHEVVDANGNLIFSFDGMNEAKKTPVANVKTGVAQKGGTGVATGDNNSISQSTDVSNNESTTTENNGTIEEESRPQPSTKKKPQQQSLKEDTQTKGSIRNSEERARDIAEEFGLSDGTYQSATRKEVSRIADYCIKKYGMENEWDRLMNKKTWDRVDFSEAGKIVLEMTKNLNRDMTRNGNRGLGEVLEKKAGETYEQYRNRQETEDKRAYQERREPIDALLQQYADQKSVRGQELQETYNFTFADELRMRASHRFLNYSRDGEVRNATDNAKSAKMWAIIDDLITRVENVEESGSAKDLVEITKMVGRIRGRENLLGKAGTRAENWMFDRMLKLGVEKDALAALAYGNIGKIMDDLTPITYADAIQTVRVTNMLSNIATGLNNLANNAISLRTQSLAQNASIPFAKAFEKLTGKKIAISDSSVFRGKDIRRAEEAALEYSILSSYYGMATEDGRVDLDNKGTSFYLNGTGLSGMAARALARYNFLVQAFVLNPDAPAKARAKLGMQKGIEKAFEDTENTPETIRNRKELEGYAAKEANRRVLQEDNAITNAVLYFKNHLLNKAKTPGEHVKVGGRELGTFKLGDFVMAFAKVPANVGIQKLEATPYGALYQTIRYAGALAKAKVNPESMTTNEMARISRDIGRAATTAGMIGLGALAAMTGALKNFDDTDDDEEKKLAREKGYSGLMLNLSQIFHGGEWQDDDLIVSGNFLEILATPLTIGAMMYDASKEGMGFLDSIAYGTKKSFTGMVDAVMDIPGLQQIGDLWTSYANQKPDDGDFDKAMKAIGQFAVSSGASYFIPNLVAQATAGADNKQRDIYTTDSYAETLRNIVMAKTPGLRKMLPEKTDTFGNTRTYGETKLGGILNTVVFPGDFKRYHVSEVETEMRRLAGEGYGKTWFDTTGTKKVEVDGEEYPLTADQRRAYHEAKAHHLLEAYDAFRTSDEYKNLTDAQRAEVYKQLRTNAEHIVKQEFMTAAEIEGEVSMSKWETLPDLDSKIRALSAKQLAGNYFDKSENEVTDYEGMDKFIKGDYAKLSDEEKDVVNSTYTYLDDIEDARENGIDSEKWEMAHNIFDKYNKPDEDGNKPEANLVNSAEMWSEIQKATGFDDNGEEMQYIQDKMHLSFQGRPNTSTYDELINDYGMSRESAAKVYAKFDPLQPTEGYSTVQDRQKWNALVESGISDKEQWDAFFAMVPTNNTKQIANMHSLQGKMNPRTLKPYTFKEAIHQLELDVVYRKETLPNGKTKKYAIN